jgi:hypothetical protein
VIYTLPGLLVAGFLGFYLVTSGGFRFGEAWVLAAAAIYLVMFLATLFGLTPALARQRTAAARALAPDAPPDAAAVLAAKAPGILSDANALFVLMLIALMSIKP